LTLSAATGKCSADQGGLLSCQGRAARALLRTQILALLESRLILLHSRLVLLVPRLVLLLSRLVLLHSSLICPVGVVLRRRLQCERVVLRRLAHIGEARRRLVLRNRQPQLDRFHQ